MRSPSGIASIYNTSARREELQAFIRHILQEGKLSKADAERFRRRLQFASNYLFGRRFKNRLICILTGVSRTSPPNCKKPNEPRLIDTRFLEWVHLYVDASFEPAGHSGVGGMLLDCRGRCLGFFSAVVSPALTPAISRADQKTVIFELEGLALATGISLFRQEIAGKDS